MKSDLRKKRSSPRAIDDEPPPTRHNFSLNQDIHVTPREYDTKRFERDVIWQPDDKDVTISSCGDDTGVNNEVLALKEIQSLSEYLRENTSTEFPYTDQKVKSFSLSSLLTSSTSSNTSPTSSFTQNRHKENFLNTEFLETFDKLQSVLRAGLVTVNNETRKLEVKSEFEVFEIDFDYLDQLEQLYMHSKDQNSNRMELNSPIKRSTSNFTLYSRDPSPKSPSRRHILNQTSTCMKKDFEYRAKRINRNLDSPVPSTPPSMDPEIALFRSSPKKSPQSSGKVSRQLSAPSLLDRSKEISELTDWLYENEIDILNIQTENISEVRTTSSTTNEIEDANVDIAVKITEAPKEDMNPQIDVCNAMDRESSNLYQRFLVLEITQSHKEKVLRVLNERGCMEAFVILRQDWCRLTIKVGDSINVIGVPEKAEPSNVLTYVVDNDKNLVVTFPDTMISGTCLSQTLECSRRAFINASSKPNHSFQTGDNSILPVYGHIIHHVFQKLIQEDECSDALIQTFIDQAIVQFIGDIYVSNTDEKVVRNHINTYIPVILKWLDKYKAKGLESGSIIQFGEASYHMKIISPLNIEEQIQSVMYGIHGNIDITLETRLEKVGPRRGRERDIIPNVMIPLELKSGNLSIAHTTQVVLYTLLLSDRYFKDISKGLLYSLKSNRTLGIHITRDTIRNIILNRNELAQYIAKNTLPPLLKRPSLCHRCYQLDACMTYHKMVERGSAGTSGIRPDTFEKITQHMTPQHSLFFNTWMDLIQYEAEESLKLRSYMWRLPDQERESIRRCMINMQIIKEESFETGHVYTFKKWSLQNSDHGFNIFDLSIRVGEHVVISEGRHLGLSNGTVIGITHHTISIKTGLKLHIPPEEIENLDIEDLGSSFAQVDIFEAKWRIDKDELISIFKSIRSNLLQLFQNNFESERKRKVIVDLESPTFETYESLSQHTPPLSSDKLKHLNEDQIGSIHKVLSAKDFALILGMPGTGKTTTISLIVQALVKRNKSVLLTAYTHSAVDSILLKLKHDYVDFLRIGSPKLVFPELREYVYNHDGSVLSVEDIETRYGINTPQYQVVATTCFGISHPLIAKRKFDYVIVDEASQITLPVCLGPILLGDVFVLVGDVYQLPPLVKSPEARQGGFSESLFKYLSEAHPQAIQRLRYQYRMNKDIMTLSNELIYQGQLRCGTPSIEYSGLSLHLQNLPQLQSSHSKDWMRDILQEDVRVIFLNTDLVPALEDGFHLIEDDACRNETEVELVVLITRSLLRCGTLSDNIGIISPWRAQLKSIQHSLTERNINVEVETVDKYQGRDKDCILFSLVRSNPMNNIGPLLKDWKRVNVAFTRAKKKLIIIGSRTTLESNHLFRSFFNDIMDVHKWVYDLPPCAHQMYKLV